MLASLDEATGVLLPRHVPPEHAVIVQVLLPVDVGAHPAKIHAVHQMKKKGLGCDGVDGGESAIVCAALVIAFATGVAVGLLPEPPRTFSKV